MASGVPATTPVPRLDPERCVLFVCDIQEKFAPVVLGFDNCVFVASQMLRAGTLLGFPKVVTEQVPGKLGKTVSSLQPFLGEDDCAVFPKTTFSMCAPDLMAGLETRSPKRKQAMIVGLEAHVCVAQTAFDLVERGWEVFILVDGVSSQRTEDRAAALGRLRDAGAVLTTSEAALFEMVRDAEHEMFKDVSKLVRETRPSARLPPA